MHTKAISPRKASNTMIFGLVCIFWLGPALQPGITLDQVFAKLNEVARDFRSIEADLGRTRVTVLVNDRDVSSGKLYYMRGGKEPRLKIEFTAPVERLFLIDKGKALLYTPKMKQADEYSLGNNAGVVDQFMALGFGQSSDELKTHYQVSLGGEEGIDGKKTALLDLTPKVVVGGFRAVRMWVDEQAGIALQVKVTETGGDYMIYKYSNIKLNGNLPASKFEIKMPKDAHVNKL